VGTAQRDVSRKKKRGGVFLAIFLEVRAALHYPNAWNSSAMIREPGCTASGITTLYRDVNEALQRAVLQSTI